MNAVRIGALEPSHRGRLREILDATAVFRPEEVSVALELFDERLRAAECQLGTVEDRGRRRTLDGEWDYELVGAFADDGALMGYACYGPTPGTQRTYDLYWIAVHPSSQGTGTGSKLLDAVERQVRERGARLLVVETSSRREYVSTHRFYRVRGYTEVARIVDFYSPSDDLVIYTKRLRTTDRGLRAARDADVEERRRAAHLEVFVQPSAVASPQPAVSSPPFPRRSSADE